MTWTGHFGTPASLLASMALTLTIAALLLMAIFARPALAATITVNTTANVTATFTEPMRATTITTATFKLRKAGETTSVTAPVTYNAATKRTTLNPSASLVAGATYTATVTSGTRDIAGNGLDQNLGLAGDQPKAWRFTVRPWEEAGRKTWARLPGIFVPNAYTRRSRW